MTCYIRVKCIHHIEHKLVKKLDRNLSQTRTQFTTRKHGYFTLIVRYRNKTLEQDTDLLIRLKKRKPQYNWSKLRTKLNDADTHTDTDTRGWFSNTHTHTLEAGSSYDITGASITLLLGHWFALSTEVNDSLRNSEVIWQWKLLGVEVGPISRWVHQSQRRKLLVHHHQVAVDPPMRHRHGVGENLLPCSKHTR